VVAALATLPVKAVETNTVCTPNEAASAIVSAEKLSRFSPRARAELVTTLITKWSLAEGAEINTPLRVDHFLAQIATETGGLTRLDENMDYSAERLLAVFPKRITPEQAANVAHQPRETANLVYFHVNGNLYPNDGWTYRGSGFLQLTGRGNFASRGDQLHMPLETQPDLVREPISGFATAIAYWSSTPANSASDLDDISKVRAIVNGGLTGLGNSKIWLARAKRVFPPPGLNIAEEANAPTPEELEAVKNKLAELGYLKRKPDESYSPADFEEALRQFQSAHNLPITGLYDDDTLYTLTDPMLDESEK
jgi:putative chitinase